MDAKAKENYRRAEKKLLELGITSRQDFDKFDAGGYGAEGLKGIGPVFRKLVQKARKMSDTEFAEVFPHIPLTAPEKPAMPLQVSDVGMEPLDSPHEVPVTWYPSERLLPKGDGD